jgi:cob(I)alamin adenosyltransferase
MTARLDGAIEQIESGQKHRGGWAIPGSNPASAALDLARTVCRRAERRTCALEQTQQLRNAEILAYLNRLSDLLWLLARRTEVK